MENVMWRFRNFLFEKLTLSIFMKSLQILTMKCKIIATIVTGNHNVTQFFVRRKNNYVISKRNNYSEFLPFYSILLQSIDKLFFKMSDYDAIST